MPDERFADHLSFPRGRGHTPADAVAGNAGGALCGDLVTIRLRIEGDRIADAGFDAEGCGATIAAGSAVVELLDDAHVLDAARIGTTQVADALGGLSVGKLHAADLAADALHRALGRAVRTQAAVPAPRPDGGGRTLVAMSGGVDSAVAALLSARDATDVATVTLELWADDGHDGTQSCCSADAVRGARALAHRMGLPHFTLDLRAEFRAGVVDPWLADHARGLTPNPCVRCNGHVRLDAMLDYADRLGAATLATGHYARITPDGLLRQAVDEGKDQAYMLAALVPGTIARLRFPLGELRKPQVRELAAQAGLPVARKPDSQDLCFLAGVGRAGFLARHGGPALGDVPGDVVDRDGTKLGEHRGHHHLTVGQRKGLGLTGGTGEPLHVLRTDPATNTVVVGPRDALATTHVPLRDVTLHRAPERVDRVRLRYRSHALPCTLRDGAVELHEPVHGAAPGQVACLLQGDVVVGCATIAR
ncbi:tRNA 2-thiouridine(34) synthase MnmA [Conexibacter sp. W3-3-2]|uniref:tRNA 2-thiouridine(34) synthase MnmA n=1 Tax=Conexibacter sp. W3-3-2 TaxID=2675227 RepID=UPI001321034E|nr:tRNA 2-thiouridine(34) synthase MnmA [Conexibacter sp. W3-3-2]MTD42930.1 tRNA 2-thiouridine(34) synthase MnmA [Conexibacter sp. W3-3-2]